MAAAMSNGPPGRASGITVVARVRPPSEMERARGDSESVRCLDDRTVQVGPRQLTFDAALGGSNQQHVFERTDMRQLLDAALQGYAATVFAYGQTGSGKTFTMSGPEGIADRAASAEGSAGDGIIPRAVRYLFNALDAHRSGRAGVSYAVSASYLEIYNEQINDLLNPASTGLPIRWNAQQGFFVEGLLVVDCETVDELMMVFREGTKNRTVGSHQLNKDSSRSHSIMQVQLTSREEIALDEHAGAPGVAHAVETHGRLSFVDLAGSERLQQSGSVGGQARETAHINRSLLVLGQVIAALSAHFESGRPAGHVPYRDSKLTKLLADSLGGSSIAMMIGCVSPAALSADESTHTLNYLHAAKKIQNRPVVQLSQASGMAASLKSLREEVHGLRAHNMALTQQLGALHAAPPPMQPAMGPGAHAHSAQLPTAQSAAALAELERELLQLRQQNAHLRISNDLLQRSYDDVKRENEALHEKLERLERVFIEKELDDDTT